MPAPITGVSIILTSYNYGRYLSRAISSARAQNVDGLEIVIVDNASTDDSWEIIKSAAADDSRIRAFRNDENIGMVANHFRGLELATKPRVLFLSVDDYLLPGHVARLLAAHAQHPEIDYFFTAYVHVDENDRFKRFYGHVGHTRSSYFGGRNEFADLLAHDCYMCTATTLLDREDMRRSGSDAKIIAGDYDHYLRLAAEGATFGFINVAGVALRIHANEITGEARYVATGQQLLEQIAILEKHLTLKNLPNVAGREQSIANLVLAKINNLRAYPDVANRILSEAQPRIDAIFTLLNESRARYLQLSLPPEPLISVILVANDETEQVLDTLSELRDQSYTNWELVLVSNGGTPLEPFLLDRANGVRIKVVEPPHPLSRAAALNDGLTLANGEIIAYATAGSVMSSQHLRRIADHFVRNPIEAVVSPVDLAVEGTTYSGFAGSSLDRAALFVGESVPLAAFSHRRSIIDRYGAFDERLEFLTDFEFVQRMTSRVSTGFDDVDPIVQRVGKDRQESALRDPAGYLRNLEMIYRHTSVPPEIEQRRSSHLQRLRAALTSGSANTYQLMSALRGAAS